MCAQLLEAHKLYLRLLLHFSPREFPANAPEREAAFGMSGRTPHAQGAGAAGQLLVSACELPCMPEVLLQEYLMHRNLLFFTALYAVQVIVKC